MFIGHPAAAIAQFAMVAVEAHLQYRRTALA